MDRKVKADGRAPLIQAAFARQARAFARSPLQTDPRRLKRLIDFVEPRAGETILDVACGPGIVAAALEAAGAFACGVDLTQEMIREASGRKGRFVQGDVAHLPFRDGAFDAAVCRNSFHHVTDPPGIMREIARVLRPGGRVIVEDMRAPGDPAKRAYHETIETLRDVAHARTLTRGEFEEMTAAAGFAGFEAVPATYVIDFEEWMDRACAAPARRAKARRLMEACVLEDRCGLRVWTEGGRLRFERRSLLFRAVLRPGG